MVWEHATTNNPNWIVDFRDHTVYEHFMIIDHFNTKQRSYLNGGIGMIICLDADFSVTIYIFVLLNINSEDSDVKLINIET